MSVSKERLLIQADEAEYLKMNKLAKAIKLAVSDETKDNDIIYQDLYLNIWKAAVELIQSNNLKDLNLEDINKDVEFLTNTVFKEFEKILKLNNIKINKEKILGQE